MPVEPGHDSNGPYYQWGKHGKKYYYTSGDEASKSRAKKRAAKQGAAAYTSGYTGNEEKENEMKRAFQFISTNVQPTVRNDRMEDKDWVVAPVVMITEGVHNGSDGPILYTKEELEKGYRTWNHRPVVVYHPSHNGVGISACDPIELSSRKIGVTMASSYVTDNKVAKVAGETWLEPGRVDKVDSRVSDAIQNNTMMELSTGLYMDLDRTSGEWNGEEYVGIARNLSLDHLAILPDMVGACSIADGAGFIRNDASEDDVFQIVENGVDVTDQYIRIRQVSPKVFTKMRVIWFSKSKGIKAVVGRRAGKTKTEVQSYLFVKDKWTTDGAKKWVKEHKGTVSNEGSLWDVVWNEMGHGSIRSLLNSALRATREEAWIEEVYDTFFIFEETGKLYRQTYSTDEASGVKIVGDAEEVVRVTEFRKASDGSFVGNRDDNVEMKGQVMKKEDLVKALIDNDKSPFKDENREELMGMSEMVLQQLSLAHEEKKPDTQTQNSSESKENKPVAVTVNMTAPVANTDNKSEIVPKTAEQYVAEAPKEIQEVLNASMASLKREKEAYITAITSNKRNTFTPEYLATRPVNELEALAKIAAPAQNAASPQPIFTGQANVADNTQSTNVEPLELPTMNTLFAKAS